MVQALRAAHELCNKASYTRGSTLILVTLESCGGEGGIRTPGTITGTSDFESGAFNRALPPLRVASRCSGADLSLPGFELFFNGGVRVKGWTGHGARS